MKKKNSKVRTEWRLWSFRQNFLFFLLQNSPKHTFSTATVLSAGAVRVQNSFFFNTNLTMQEKVKHRRRESEEKVCVVWRKWKLCAFGICVTDPLKKCIRAIVEVAGLGESYSQRTPDH